VCICTHIAVNIPLVIIALVSLDASDAGNSAVETGRFPDAVHPLLARLQTRSLRYIFCNNLI